MKNQPDFWKFNTVMSAYLGGSFLVMVNEATHFISSLLVMLSLLFVVISWVSSFYIKNP